jgi:hypothetical protein
VPAAAVIPAPIAYIKVVAVKKLVVELESVLGGVGLGAFPLWGVFFLFSAGFSSRESFFGGGGRPGRQEGAIPNRPSFPVFQAL